MENHAPRFPFREQMREFCVVLNYLTELVILDLEVIHVKNYLLRFSISLMIFL